MEEINFENNWLNQWDVVPRGLYLKTGVDECGKPVAMNSGYKIFTL
jgi:hypothetical protein